MVIEVKLTQRRTTIDDADAELVELRWYKNSNDYAAHSVWVVGQKRTVLLMHRVIMEQILGRPLLPSEEVDHFNGDPLDNRRSNLRLADDRQQRANSNKCSRNKKGDQPSSDYKGVSWSCEKGKWKAQKWFHGLCVYCELFDDEIQAAFAYDRASIKYEGEFARLNFPWGIVPQTGPIATSRSQPGPKQLRYRKPHSSEYYGVFWADRDKKWIAEIRVNRHLIYLGNFDDEVEAARTVDRAVIKYLGAEDAKPRLNFPISDYTETSMVGRIVKDVLSYMIPNYDRRSYTGLCYCLGKTFIVGQENYPERTAIRGQMEIISIPRLSLVGYQPNFKLIPKSASSAPQTPSTALPLPLSRRAK